ncbi:hypothetical protein J2P12_05660 [Candidatus Bathyarchaeota archaeon]|nr:hypothetical protein [Candidatus Bathyarchaeota archaeon]
MLRASAFVIATLVTLMAMVPLAQVHAATQTYNINQSKAIDGVTVTLAGSITVDTTAKTVTGSITVTVVNNTSGQTIYQKTIQINFTPNSPTGNFVLMIPTPSGTFAASCNSTGACILSKTPDVANQGTINIVDLATIAIHYGTANTQSDIDGDGLVSIVDLAITASDFGAPIFY